MGQTISNFFHPVLGVEIAFGLLSNFYAFYFIYFKLKVHKHIRKHLIVASAEYCVGMAVMGVGYVLKMTSLADDLTSCMLYSISLSQCLNGGGIMSAVIATIRYVFDAVFVVITN